MDDSVYKGDSGGPLVTKQNGRYEVSGVVSFGEKCGSPDYPSVFANSYGKQSDIFYHSIHIMNLCLFTKLYWIGSNQPLDQESAQEVKTISRTQIGD